MHKAHPTITNRLPRPLILAGSAIVLLALAGWAAWQSHRAMTSLDALARGAAEPEVAADALRNVGFTLAGILLVAGLALGVAWLRARSQAEDDEVHSPFHAAVEQSSNGVLIVDAGSLQVIDANPAFCNTLGFNVDELRALTLTQVFIDPAGDADALLTKLRNPDPSLPLQVQQRSKDGTLLDVEVSGNRVEVGSRRVLAFTTNDITLRRKIEAQLLENQQRLDHLAHHDQLTGLPNRLYLAAHLPGAIDEAKRRGTPLAVLFLDLDRFKHINDSRGHEAGDKLLKSVARRIRRTVRTEDMVVRMGGDEFIVVLKNVESADQVNETAARINAALSAPIVVGGQPLVTTVSIGVSLYPRDGADMGELLRRSDAAMYQAKDRGRNNFQLFNPVLDRRLKERVTVEASLRAALEQSQLDVHYQPIIDIQSNTVVALEALLRWRHPTQGFIPPNRFIGVAEETGLIVPIGDFVLERVMQDAVRWRAGGALLVPVAVNISAVQLQRSSLKEKIVELTTRYGLKPDLLQLELTESAVFERRQSRYGESHENTIAELRQLGVRIAIDDFGTGYSSLSYLKHWRVDYLKIDRGFVRDVVTDTSDLAIVGAITAIARHLDIEVVAEGVEGWQQLEKLRQLDCRLAQGYLFAKPAPAGQCLRFLSGRPLDLTALQEPVDHLEATGS